MSEVSPQSAFDLRQAILGHNTWDESMPELAGLTREGFVAISGSRVERSQLPVAVLARLGIVGTDVDDGSEYEVDLGRRVNRRFSSVSDMFRNWPDGQRWDPAYVYSDYGTDAAYVRVGRASADTLRFVYYFVSAQESHQPGQSPLCDVRVAPEDHTPMRQLVTDLGEQGGSLVDLAWALGIDPLTGKADPDKPEVMSDTDLRINLANQLGEPLSEAEIATSREDETAAAATRSAEEELQPLTTNEVLGLAALVGAMRTSVQC